MDDPERIWLEPGEGFNPNYGRTWCPADEWEGEGIEYIRADLAAAHTRAAVEAAEARIERLEPEGISVAAAVEAAEARIVAWTEAEAAEFLKSPKDSLEFFHGESLLELARCYRDGEHRRQS
jgi:hypothetical protein